MNIKSIFVIGFIIWGGTFVRATDPNDLEHFFTKVRQQIEKGDYREALQAMDLKERNTWPNPLWNDRERYGYELKTPGWCTLNYLRAQTYARMEDTCSARFFAFRALDIRSAFSMAAEEKNNLNFQEMDDFFNHLADKPDACGGETPFLPLSHVGTGFQKGGVYDIEILPKGGLLLAGNFMEFNGHPVHGLLRLTSEGAIDRKFLLASEKALKEGAREWLEVNNAQVLPDGKILICLTKPDNLQMRVCRLFSTGALDKSFQVWDIRRESTKEGFLRLIVSETTKEGDIFLGTLLGQFFLKGAPLGPLIAVDQNGRLRDWFPVGPGKPITVMSLAEDGIGKQDNGGIIFAGSFFRSDAERTSPMVRVGPDGRFDWKFYDIAVQSRISRVCAMAIRGDEIALALRNRDPRDYLQGLVEFLPDGSLNSRFTFQELKTNYGYAGQGNTYGRQRLRWTDKGFLVFGYPSYYENHPTYLQFVNDNGEYSKTLFHSVARTTQNISDMERLKDGRFILATNGPPLPLKKNEPHRDERYEAGKLVSFQRISLLNPADPWPNLTTIREIRGTRGFVGAETTNIYTEPDGGGTVLREVNKSEWVKLLKRGALLDQRNGMVDYWQNISDKNGTVGWVFGGDLSYLPEEDELAETVLISACVDLEEGTGKSAVLVSALQKDRLLPIPKTSEQMAGYQWAAANRTWKTRKSKTEDVSVPFKYSASPLLINGSHRLTEGSPPLTEIRPSQISLGACVNEGDSFMGIIGSKMETRPIDVRIQNAKQRLSSKKSIAISIGKSVGRKAEKIVHEIYERTWPYANE